MFLPLRKDFKRNKRLCIKARKMQVYPWGVTTKAVKNALGEQEGGTGAAPTNTPARQGKKGLLNKLLVVGKLRKKLLLWLKNLS